MSVENLGNREHARRLAKASELAEMANRASNPGSRATFLELAAAFRRLADMVAPHPPNGSGA